MSASSFNHLAIFPPITYSCHRRGKEYDRNWIAGQIIQIGFVRVLRKRKNRLIEQKARRSRYAEEIRGLRAAEEDARLLRNRVAN